jgi:hypothetical protein
MCSKSDNLSNLTVHGTNQVTGIRIRLSSTHISIDMSLGKMLKEVVTLVRKYPHIPVADYLFIMQTNPLFSTTVFTKIYGDLPRAAVNRNTV